MTPEQVAKLFGVSPDQVRAQYRKNANQLSEMAEHARKTGRKVNGYSEAELRASARAALAKADDM